MKGFVRLVAVVVIGALSAVSCSKDKDSGSVTFEVSAAYFQKGQQLTIGFSGRNIRSYSVTTTPTGWNDPVISTDNTSITIVAPAPTEFDDEVVSSGSVVLTGTTPDGTTATATLFVAIVDSKDLSGKVANSYLLNKKNTHYLLDATHKGDGTTSLATSSVDVIWQSVSGLVQYLRLDEGKLSFYIGADDDDEHIKEGNALIGAYDADGTLLWSWHVWAADYDTDVAGGTVDLNGYTMMTRNLGALAQDNSTTANILASFGLYYQWGRKDPFIGPSTYKAGSGSDAYMYNGSGSRVYRTEVASSADTGTETYATQHPLVFITSADMDADWVYSGSSTWSSDSDAAAKAVNDPCPYGWRVAPAAAFDGLSFVGAPTASDFEKYGWTLTGGSAQSLFMAAGRRIWMNGYVQNVYDDSLSVRSADEAQPWVGYYWTTAPAAGNLSTAFGFWFKKADASSGLRNDLTRGRANGMSVRCVKRMQ